ncbi:hypothetical protein [Actinoplanes awajinensis]|uniref:HTH tetR-type domain-containing protein n=1 Tax=Actinoplanes awajinensis subsp. mycoplanecinus TaxID=135947 RepID=A0A101JB65_9ACTN|nr:hypothetical protein [Actinoplanes awajinensis]KUL23565.1 hypothetical protein ADL15_46220 [Actinoplanes awajinensis subsp. mycoplanecinus]
MNQADERAGPLGPSSRRRRISDGETARRMLQAAITRVNSAGLTVSLDHISFEDVIREAGVSRSTAYRRWPYKDLFFADLLRELARGAAPASTTGTAAFERALADGLLAAGPALDRADRRHALLTEVLRRSADADFDAVRAATEWHTYLALQATFLGLPDGALREEIRAGLAAADRGFVERIGRSWAAVCAVFGYRPRPGSGAGFATIALQVTASLRGFVTMATVDPEAVTARLVADPSGTGAAEWTAAGLAVAAIAFTFLEPDPEFVWSADRLATLLGELGAERSAAVFRDLRL